LRTPFAGGEDAGDTRTERGLSLVQYVVLAVIVIAAIVITVDTIRHRADVRRRPQVDRAVAASLTGQAAAIDVASHLEAQLRREDEGSGRGDDIWTSLSERLDPTTFRPKLAAGTEWKVFRLPWSDDYAIVANPLRTVHFRLPSTDVELFPLLDGTRSVSDLIVERLDDAGDLDADAIIGLTGSLYEGGFLDQAALDTQTVLERALERSRTSFPKLRKFAKTLQIEWEGPDPALTSIYQRILRYFFKPISVIAMIVIALGGVAAFISVERSGRFHLNATAAPAESAILIALSFVLTFAHELGHASVEKHYGRKVGRAGFSLYFGRPSFYVGASDSLMMDRWPRVALFAAGPFAELVLAGLASIVLFAFPDMRVAPFLFRFALLNLFIIILNLIPLLELDGYWILTDLIQVPDLRPRSLEFIQHDLWHKLRTRERFTPQELGLAAYGLVGSLFAAFVLVTAFYFWRAQFGGIVQALWDGGTLSRILLVLLALFVAGPLIRGIVALGRSLWRRVKATSKRARFRFETRWRVEAAQLIDALPAFEDLPEDVLSDLAGRVQLRVVRAGQPIFRQGDRGDAFYVVRQGNVLIETEHPETGETNTLRTLRRGDSFGELGLLQSTPRSATARASDEVELFEVGRGTFDRLLADSIDAPEFGLTLQAMAELREHPAFRHLSSEALGNLIEYGRWVTPSTGQVIVAQGERGDAFYAIRSGHVDVIRDGQHVTQLGPGDHFGEVALLNDQPRNASVIAHTPVRAFQLSREGFNRVIAEAFHRHQLLPPTEQTWEY
jgi:CRP-like cAMP-binding protein/Zn-dependent protease